MFRTTGRVRTPSPTPLSEEELEIVDLLSDSTGGVEAEKRKSKEICRCDGEKKGAIQSATADDTQESLREPHFVVCVEEEPEIEGGTVEVEEKAAATTSESSDNVHNTDSDFVPSDGDQETDSDSTSTSADNVQTEDEVSEAQSVEEGVTAGLEKCANEVRFSNFRDDANISRKVCKCIHLTVEVIN